MPFDFEIKDIVDILLVALMLYYIYRLMKESRSLNIFIGIMVFVLVWLFVSQVLEMRLMGSILDKLVSVGVIAIIVLFQEEIRKFLYDHAYRDGMHEPGASKGGRPDCGGTQRGPRRHR